MATNQEAQKILAELRAQTDAAIKRVRQTVTALELEIDESAPNYQAVTNLSQAINMDVNSLVTAAALKLTYKNFENNA